MCIKPDSVWVKRGPRWEQTPKPCGNCWRCRQNYMNDYVGRCLAEAATSVAFCAITLTYGPRDDLADKVLMPLHFQLFMKRLRRVGHKVRYLAVGEYGSLKDRAHFHVLLFFKKLVPGIGVPQYNWGHLSDPESSLRFCGEMISDREKLVHVREWPHGHVTCEWNGGERAVRYVCKYLLKGEKGEYWFSPSKKPPLGAEWFAQKARQARELGVLPSSFEYLPPGGNRDRPYLMTGATRRDYLAALGDIGDRRKEMSEWVQRSYDKHQRDARLDDLEALAAARPARIGFYPEAPPEPEYQHVTRNAEWFSGRRVEEFELEIDPEREWDYPFSHWTPPLGAGDGKAQGSFFGESRIFNPRPREALRAVAGHFSGGPGEPAAGRDAARRCRRQRQDERTPGQQPEVFQGKLV